MDAIERLKEKRALLSAQLEKVDAAIAQHEFLQQVIDDLLADGDNQSPKRPTSITKYSVKAESDRRRVSNDVAEFERGIRDILLIAHQPLDRTELLKICVERNIPVGGQEPLNTLASRMSRMPGVTNIRGKGYFLSERLDELLSSKDMLSSTPPAVIGAVVAHSIDLAEKDGEREELL